MTDRMDEILNGLAHGDSPIELRMQVSDSAHSRMLAEIKNAALERLEGDRLKSVLKFIEKLEGK